MTLFLMFPILYLVQVKSLPCFSFLGPAMGSGSSSVRLGNWGGEEEILAVREPRGFQPQFGQTQQLIESCCLPVGDRTAFSILVSDCDQSRKQILLCSLPSSEGHLIAPWENLINLEVRQEHNLLGEGSLSTALQNWRTDTEQKSKEHRTNHELLSDRNCSVKEIQFPLYKC